MLFYALCYLGTWTKFRLQQKIRVGDHNNKETKISSTYGKQNLLQWDIRVADTASRIFYKRNLQNAGWLWFLLCFFLINEESNFVLTMSCNFHCSLKHSKLFLMNQPPQPWIIWYNITKLIRCIGRLRRNVDFKRLQRILWFEL